MSIDEKPVTWSNRIVGEGEISPYDLLPHPMNWRRHPMAQQKALAGVLEEIGWVQRVVVNRSTGRLVDGHLRVRLAQENGMSSVPVLYVELSETEEAAVLATLDPIAALAETDRLKLEQLLQSVCIQSDAVQSLLTDLSEQEGTLIDGKIDLDVGDQTEELTASFQILVQCQSEEEQLELLVRLESEGLQCRALIA